MAKVITLSGNFLKGHPKEGQPTYFVESIYKELYILKTIPKELEKDYSQKMFLNAYTKKHTIRFGRRWKTGDKASLRVWSGKPYRSPQIAIAPDVELRVVDIIVDYENDIPRILLADGKTLIAFMKINKISLSIIAQNDGLSEQDFLDWFQVGKKKGTHEAQILIWGNVNEY